MKDKVHGDSICKTMEPDIDERLERDGGNKEGKLLLVTYPEFPENGMDAGFSSHVGYDVQLERENEVWVSGNGTR